MKPVDAFSRNRSNSDGLASYCKPCFSVRGAEAYRRKRARQGHTVRTRVVVAEGQKRCPACETIKPLEDFARASKQSGGRASYCKSCNNARQRQARFLKTYGLTPEALQSLVDGQGGWCALCRQRPAVHVDHDHVVGTVRGVVCFRCNVGLGHFSDSAAILRAAIDYLERTTWQRTQVCTGVYRLTSPRLAARRSASSSDMQRLICFRGAGSCPPA
jgi:hypothetical protein